MLPNELCLLEWYGYPFKSLVRGFQPGNLIELSMPNSHIEWLWPNGSIKSLGSLKRFDLSNSKSLIEAPDLTVAPKLESLHLEDCPSLSEIHPSIFHHNRLKLLNLRACTSLQSLPDEIGLKSLERLYLSDCSRLKKLPDAMGNMTALRLLYLNGTSIKELPFSIESCLAQDFEDMDNAEVTHFWRHFSSRTTIKFSDGISMPVLHNLGAVSLEDFNHPKIEAVYIGFDGRPTVFTIGLNMGVPANWFLVRAKNVDGWSYLKVSVSAIFKVKECGVRLVHEHDAQEFYDSITCMYPLGSLDSEFLHNLYSYSGNGLLQC
ncbi:putative WRKY transcription factor 19 [Morella rubra]|uniref:Putative WRKY transcription factor 19 n=1 Tax=Morella rubra TaxID=262757 RepID=A0A6A1VHA5_9ROSI|nr:putative WRKY transcription factor 19 [Morella rubra]